MSKRKPAGSSAETRKKLMLLAARAFGSQGYAATSMRQIAQQAGIEAASIYYHFASKEELVEAVMEHGAENIMRHTAEKLASLPEGADARQRFKAALLGQMEAIIQYGDYAFARGRLQAQLPDRVRARQVERRERYKAFWDELFGYLRSEGFLRHDAAIGLFRVLVLGAINSAVAWYDAEKGSPEQVVEALCEILFDGIGAESS